MTEVSCTNSKVAMIESLVFSSMLTLIHTLIKLSIAFKDNLMHIIIHTNGLIKHSALASYAKLIYPVVLSLSEYFSSVKFQLGKQNVFISCLITNHYGPLRGPCTIEFCIIWDL